MRRAVLPLITMSLICAGCAERQAQVAVQSSLTGLAHGVHAADEIVAERMPTAAEEARSAMLEERRVCGEAEPPDPDCPAQDDMPAWMSRYESRMETWNTGVTALRGVRESLYIGQAAVTAWIEAGSLPASWGTFCGSVGDGLASVLEMLEVVGVDVPPELQAASGFASRACELAGPWFHAVAGTEDEEEE